MLLLLNVILQLIIKKPKSIVNLNFPAPVDMWE